MARTQGPLFSADATGQVGKLLAHSHWKGRSYVKRTSTPTNPNTAPQLAVRAMMAWLNSQWNAAIMTNTIKDLWAAFDAGEVLPPINKFLRHNLDRWADGLAPLLSPPPFAAGASPTFNVLPNETGGIRRVVINWDVGTMNQSWAIAVHRSLVTGFTPDRTNLVAVHATLTTVATTALDAPLDPATYFYRNNAWTTGGKISQAGTQRTAVVTN